MKLFVIFFASTLVLYIILYGLFIPMSTNRADEIPFGPELSSPQLLFHCRYSLEYLSGRYTLNYFHYLRWTILRN